jgi:photosystem II stability/assembly factor-like uncharacterized protein
VYWSRIGADDKPHWGTPEIRPALYKSLDGGRTWRELPGTSEIGGSIVACIPGPGSSTPLIETAFIGAPTAGGRSKKTLDGGEALGVDVSRAAPDLVVASRRDGVWRSADAGRTWAKVPGSAAIANGDPLRNVRVSPADARCLLVWREGANWQWPRFVSRDGGATWRKAGWTTRTPFCRTTPARGCGPWHPTDPRVAWSVGGDWPTRSDDGGATWRWSGNGYNVVLVGGMFAFNAQNPDLLFVGLAGLQRRTDARCRPDLDLLRRVRERLGRLLLRGLRGLAEVMFAGNAPGWGGPRTLRITRDGGRPGRPTRASSSRGRTFPSAIRRAPASCSRRTGAAPTAD